MYQSIVAVGNVGREPKLNFTSAGIPVLNFSVAVNKVTGKGEARKEKTVWFAVDVWREQAEGLSTFLRQGHRVLVIGEVDLETFQKNDGTMGAKLVLHASSVKVLDKKENGVESQPVEETESVPF